MWAETPPKRAHRTISAVALDHYLSEQADLRVVERFARTDVSGRTGRWSELIPLSAPGPGEQYRFDVDLDSCTGCKACVSACHSLNGLDEGESFRSVGLLITPRTQVGPAEQTVTTACHHCVDPACMTGCPAKAYEKDPVTGIVKHLDDACIGCQYCTLTCPYEVPVFNDRLGIVRKCDMCADRLGEGEAPACVQGCPTEAISITTVAVDQVVTRVEREPARLVAGAAPSALTNPTTTYRGRHVEADSGSAFAVGSPEPQHGHLPLVIMLTLSQFSVGSLLASALALTGSDAPSRFWMVGVTLAAIVGAISALASFAHLGQPLKAWRVVLGWSHSWLSREAIVLGAYVVSALALSVYLWWNENALVANAGTGPSIGAVSLLVWSVAAVGIAAVACSVMLYVVTGRHWWRGSQTSVRFGATVVLSALAWLVVLAANGLGDAAANGSGLGDAAPVLVGIGVVVVAAAKAAVERSVFRATDIDSQRTAELLAGPLSEASKRRLVLLGGAAFALVVSAFWSAVWGPGAWPLVAAGVGVFMLLAGELAARRLFFQACAPETMPGTHR